MDCCDSVSCVYVCIQFFNEKMQVELLALHWEDTVIVSNEDKYFF